MYLTLLIGCNKLSLANTCFKLGTTHSCIFVIVLLTRTHFRRAKYKILQRKQERSLVYFTAFFFFFFNSRNYKH